MLIEDLRGGGMAAKTKGSYEKEEKLLKLILAAMEDHKYKELGYKTLLKFCVCEFGLSESSAYRRIQVSKRIKKGAV